MKRDLWNHQVEGVQRALKNRGRFGLFFEPGTGKTPTAAEILNNSEPGDTLVVAPKICLLQWKEELDHIAENIFLLNGKITDRAKILMSAPKRSIFLCNYQSFTNKVFRDVASKRGLKHIVLDESHKIKSPDAATTKALLALSKSLTGCRLLLTGTPLLNDVRDLWSQERFMGTNVFSDNFFVFRARYLYDANSRRRGRPGYFPNWQPRPGAAEEIAEKLKPYVMTVKKEEVLKSLPPLIQKTIKVELPPATRKVYEDMRKNFIASVKDENNSIQMSVASVVGTKVLRMMQICNGVLEGDGTTCELECEKDAALEELLGELTPSTKVIVWSYWKGTYERIRRICNRSAIGFRELHGEVSGAVGDRNVSEFKTDTSVRVLLANPAAGGVGLNLQVAGASVYYSKPWHFEYEAQSAARNYRAGSEQHGSILRFDLVTEDSIEEEIELALREKRSLSDYIMSIRSIRSMYGDSGGDGAEDGRGSTEEEGSRIAAIRA